MEPTTTNTWRILSLDVCGNEDDGYDLNAVYRTSHTIALPDDATDAQVADALVECQYLSERMRNRCRVEAIGDDMLAIDDEQSGRPLVQLERVTSA